jgi:hypothetical protein
MYTRVRICISTKSDVVLVLILCNYVHIALYYIKQVAAAATAAAQPAVTISFTNGGVTDIPTSTLLQVKVLLLLTLVATTNHCCIQ